MEIILSTVAIIISMISISKSSKANKLAQEANDIAYKQLLKENEKDSNDRLKEYRDFYSNLYIKNKGFINNIPNITSDIGLLLHKYSIDKSKYINHNFSSLKFNIIKSLNHELEYNLLDKLRSLSIIDQHQNNIFTNNEKEHITTIYKNIDDNKYLSLKDDFIKIYEKIQNYKIQYQNDINNILEKIEYIEIKIKNDSINFDTKLDDKYQRLKQLCNLLLKLNDIHFKVHNPARVIKEDIIFYSSIIILIEELQYRIKD